MCFLVSSIASKAIGEEIQFLPSSSEEMLDFFLNQKKSLFCVFPSLVYCFLMLYEKKFNFFWVGQKKCCVSSSIRRNRYFVCFPVSSIPLKAIGEEIRFLLSRSEEMLDFFLVQMKSLFFVFSCLVYSFKSYRRRNSNSSD